MKATTIVGMVLGILGGLIALLIGAFGFGIATVGGGVSGTIGYNAGVSTALFYRIVTVLFPVLAILGAGLAAKSVSTSMTLQSVSIVGILISFGLNMVSLVPCILIGLSVIFVGLESGFSIGFLKGAKLDWRFFLANGIVALVTVLSLLFGITISIVSGHGGPGQVIAFVFIGLPFLFVGITRKPISFLFSSLFTFFLFGLASPLVFLVLFGGFESSSMFIEGATPVLSGLLSALVSYFVMKGRARTTFVAVVQSTIAGAVSFLVLFQVFPISLGFQSRVLGIIDSLLVVILLAGGTTALIWLAGKLRPAWPTRLPV